MKLTPEQIAQVGALLPGWTYRQCNNVAGEWTSPHAGWALDTSGGPVVDSRLRFLDPATLRREADQAASAAALLEQFSSELQPSPHPSPEGSSRCLTM